MLKDLKQFNLPEIEEKVLEFWRKNNIFEKSLRKNPPSPKGLRRAREFIFYEGPPSANAPPGTHHVLARVFKDIILRFKTMQGYYVPRRAGWDTQGLPIEVQVEKELGIKNKQEIEQMGVAEFNRKAKSLVWQYKDEWEKLTDRIGFWLDLKNAYITYDNNYLEKLWSVFKKIDKRKLLVKGHKVVPWCPRCGTALSSHELAQGYKEITDQSVYVKFKLKDKPNTYILSWTTTPWTLPGNVALAVGEEIDYVGVNKDKETFILAKERLMAVFGSEQFDQQFKGEELVGLSYEPLFDIKQLKSPASYKIYAADFVTTTDGTGVVHTAVMYGEDDFELGKKNGLPQHHTVTKDGKFTKAVKELADLPVKNKTTEEKIFQYLKNKKYLLDIKDYVHDYPFCWRCGTAIIYYANDSWFILMSKLRKDLLAANQKINWIPEHLKEGRFGEWLKEVKDWAISRERYWGTPLPIWECAKCDSKLVVGSLDDLNKHDCHQNKYWIARHGESTHNIGKWFSGDQESDKKSELTESGIKQVEATAQKLKNKKIDLIYSSPFLRTKQTAAIYKKLLKAEVVYDKRLAEVNEGMFNGKLGIEKEGFYETEDEVLTKRPLNGENLLDVKKRVMDFIADINRQHVGKNILIISHGDPLAMLQASLANISKEQFWVWYKENYLSVGGLKSLEFNNWPFDQGGNLDLHRPYIDEVTLRCSKCEGVMKRVKEVADVWFDSGAMPFAADEYPDRYPADYICEAIDQTRGWFYTLLAVGVLLEEGTPYKNVISLGHILDKQGQKMSKSKGNVVDPWDLINKYGVDVLRWYFYTVNPPGEPKKFDEADLGKTYRRFVALLYNSYVFWATYDEQQEKSDKRQVKDKQRENILDRWILTRLNQVIDQATKKLNKYEIGEAAKEIESLVDDLSHWYIRRSRKRPEALPILRQVLLAISQLSAPFTPFFSEALYKSLTQENESIHLTDWPAADKKLVNKNLIEQMMVVRQIASLALAKRAEAGIKVRQPLLKLKIKSEKLKVSEELLTVLKDEINVREIVFDKSIKEEIELDTTITLELKDDGMLRELARSVQGLRQKAGYQPSHGIALFLNAVGGYDVLKKLLKKYPTFKKDVNANNIFFETISKELVDIETEISLDGMLVSIQIKKS